MSKVIAVTVDYLPNGNVRLAPADALADDQMRELPRGARLNANVAVARNSPEDEHMGLLRLYHAGINTLYENMDSGPGTDFPTPRHVRKEILNKTGFCTIIPQRDGGERRDPDSMAIDKMEVEDLKYCLELSQQYAVERWGFNPWDLWKELHPFPHPKPGVPR